MATERAELRQMQLQMRPTLLVGLGGTGQKVLVHLKARFMRNYGDVPPAIEFLAFDTDQAAAETRLSGNRVRLTPDTELVNIGGVQTAEIVRTLDRHPAYAAWMAEDKERFPRQAIVQGAKQVRPLGRLSFFWHVDEIYERVQTAVDRLTYIGQESEKRGINVFVVSSVCGGTGAGMFLDMAYLVRQVIQQSGIQGEFCYINAVLALPSVFPNVDPVGIESNAFAALSELDYAMTNALWKVDYGSARVKEIEFDGQRPFNICYLIDSRNERGQGLNGLEEIAPMVAEAMYLQISNQVGEANASTFDNVRKLGLSTVNLDNGKTSVTAYSSFGTASLIFPADDIVEYCAYRLGSNILSEQLLQKHEDEDAVAETLERFTQQNDLEPEQLLGNLSRDGNDRVQGVNLDPHRLNNIKQQDLQAAVRKYVSREEKRVDDELSPMLESNQASLEEKLEAALAEEVGRLLNDPTYGPWFTVSFLEALDKFSQKLREELGQQRDEHDQRRNRARKAANQRHQEFLDAFGSFVLGRKRRITEGRDAFIVASKAYLVARYEARRREVAIAVLASLSTSAQRQRSRVQALLDRLRFINAQFETVVNRYRNRSDSHILAREITDVDDMDDYFRQYRDLGPANRLAALMEQEGELTVWLDCSQEEISEHILHFTRGIFEDIRETSVEQVILDKDTEDKGEKRLQDLIKRSVPFWNYNQAGVLEPSWKPEEIVVVGVDEEETSIYRQALMTEQLLASTFDPHRIIVLQTKHGLPLFALKQYEQYRSKHDHAMQRNLKPLYILPEVRPGGHKAKQMFALGAVFGYIFKAGTFYYMKPSNAIDRPTQMAQGLSDALQYFRSQEELITLMDERVQEFIAREGSERAGRIIESFIKEPYILERRGGVTNTDEEMVKDTSIGNQRSNMYDIGRDLREALQKYLEEVVRG